MKNIIKSVLKKLINLSVAFIGTIPGGRYLYSQIVSNAMSRTQKINHQGVSLVFSVPNPLNKYRADSFSNKEPETLEWIDDMPRGSVVWDIGANVGIYSVYAAKSRDCRVWAFEPSVFNLECLARNSYLNDLTEKITIVPIALSDKTGSSQLHMTTTEWGGAMSTFDKDYGHDGNKLSEAFRFGIVGVAMDAAVEYLNIPTPDYIKLDVDGIEHLVLRGGNKVLSKIRGILIEINDDFTELSNECSVHLKAAGLTLKEKRQGPDMAQVGHFAKTFNQIWCRSGQEN